MADSVGALYSDIVGNGDDRFLPQAILMKGVSMLLKWLPYRSDRILIILLLLQAVFWFGIPTKAYFEHAAKDVTEADFLWPGVRSVVPFMEIVPDVPSELTVKALSFGDEQFYFRVLAMEIQNAGDTYGRFTALRKYDYNKLEKWFYLLDTLDPKASHIVALASYIFSQTPKYEDLPHMVRYIEDHSYRDLRNNWWWMSQAVIIANHKLKDKKWALELAYKLAETPDDVKKPIWVKQMPAFILEQLGEKAEALAIIYGIAQSADDLSPGEINFMNYFIQQRLGMVNEAVENMQKMQQQQDAQPPQSEPKSGS